MNTRLVLFTLLILGSFLGQAQYKISFEDNFDDDSKGWYYANIDGPDMTRSISNGKLYIHQKKLAQNFWTLNPIFSDPTKPFVLETNIVKKEGESVNGFGFVMMGRESKNYFFLIIPETQLFYVGHEQKGTWTTLNPTTASSSWATSTAIKGLNENNNLKVQNADGKISFLINDVEIYSSVVSPVFNLLLAPNYIGIVTRTVQKIEVDNLIFKQDNPPINIVPNLPKLSKVNLGTNVNSKYTEKCPYISPDGKTLYYVVTGAPENKGTAATDDDIYYALTESDSTWGARKNAGFPLNNSWPNCVLTATPDNNTLYLMHTYKADGSPNAAGFSMTTRTENGWSVPVDLKVENYYNKASYNEFCFSVDRKVLLMTVQRDDSYGQKDVYVSFLKDDGIFSEPKNLGATVNTFAVESSPFLAADGKTLYYSTSGFPGYGSADIYMTRRLDSTWTNWSTPQNMGPDVNSKDWEAYYSVPASGKYAYVVSEAGIEGSTDLYRIKLPESLKPKPVVLVYGKVLNSKTKEPLLSTINYNELSTNKELGLASSNPTDGTYKIILPAGEVYSFLASKKGYFSVSENIDLSKLTEYKEIERDLYLAPLEIGESIRLNNLFFDFNKSLLRKESFPELERVVVLLNANPSMTIEIAGHTDNIGDDLVNNKLSNERAKAVKTFLESKGISPERIVAKGYGKTKPVASNANDEGRQRNRRVEFLILKK